MRPAAELRTLLSWSAARCPHLRAHSGNPRRAYALGIYSEATYRRGYMQLNRRGWRESEPEEPAMERPRVLQEVIHLLEQAGIPRSEVAERVHLHAPDLEELLRLPALR